MAFGSTIHKPKRSRESSNVTVNQAVNPPGYPIRIEVIKPNLFDSVPKILEKLGFKLGSIIGEGTYSKVRKAEIIGSPQPGEIAVKIINRRHASKDFVGKFLPREIEILSKIVHPNIVTIHRILELEDNIYIFMDLAHSDLLAYIQKNGGPIPADEARHIFFQIASAVQFLHDHNFCHRDLKCENILLFENGVVKLSDFGFAKKLVKNHDFRMQMSRTFCGSAAYAAPEILSGIPYEPRLCDMWSLGCILFILLTNVMPFDDSNVKAMLRYQLARKPRFPLAFEEKYGPDAKDLISLMLEPETERRIRASDIFRHNWMREKELSMQQEPICQQP